MTSNVDKIAAGIAALRDVRNGSRAALLSETRTLCDALEAAQDRIAELEQDVARLNLLAALLKSCGYSLHWQDGGFILYSPPAYCDGPPRISTQKETLAEAIDAICKEEAIDAALPAPSAPECPDCNSTTTLTKVQHMHPHYKIMVPNYKCSCGCQFANREAEDVINAHLAAPSAPKEGE